MFSQRLKLLRNEKNLLQKELADKLNISRSTIASWESGNRIPELGAIEKLSDFFEVSIDYLLGKTDFRNHAETIALHRTDSPTDDLPQEALDKIEEFKELMRLKYQKK